MFWRYLTVAAFSAAVLFVQPASAGTIDITLVAAAQTGSPGDILTFTGTIANNSGIDLFLNGAGINLNGFDPADSDLTDFVLNFAGPLSDGGSIGPADMFTVAIPTPFPAGAYTGEFTLQGGLDDTGDAGLGTASFEVDVNPVTTSPVPEPGPLVPAMASLALIFSVLRRR